MKEDDVITWKAEFRLIKFRDEDGTVASKMQKGASEEAFADRIIGIEEWEHNMTLVEGLAEACRLILGKTATPFNSTNAHIGVGNGTAPATSSQMGLQGSLKLYKGMDDGYPALIDQTMVFRATFANGEANFSWEESTVANGNSDAAKNLNRKVEHKTVKTSSEAWTMIIKITLGSG